MWVLVGELLDAAEGLVGAAIVDKEYLVVGVFFERFDEFFGEGGDVILFVITRYYYRYLKPFGIFSVNIHYIYYLLNLPNFLLINTSAYNHL